MVINCLTTFPEFIESLRSYSIIKRAIEDEKIILNSINIRDFSKDNNRRTDDYPYGGGLGMLMTCQPIVDAISSIDNPGLRIFLGPSGVKLDQNLLNKLSKEDNLTFLCGHYEGVDQRVLDNYIDIEISVGDYVLTGGEIPFMTVLDGVTRLIPGVLKEDKSYEAESFYNGLIEHPQYTRPYDFNGYKVPDILLSGDHEKIRLYNLEQSLKITKERRPDLYDRFMIENCNDKDIIKILKRKGGN